MLRWVGVVAAVLVPPIEFLQGATRERDLGQVIVEFGRKVVGFRLLSGDLVVQKVVCLPLSVLRSQMPRDHVARVGLLGRDWVV